MEEEGEGEGGGGRDGGEHGEGGVAYEAAGYALEGGGVDGEADVRGDFGGLVTKQDKGGREGHTVDQDAVGEGVHGPHVRSPVGVAQAP